MPILNSLTQGAEFRMSQYVHCRQVEEVLELSSGYSGGNNMLFILARKVREKFAAILRHDSYELYHRYFFGTDSNVGVSLYYAFAFKHRIYRDQRRYRARWKLRRHFFEPEHVPAFDGVENEQEFQCARAVDVLPSLKFWMRNVSRAPQLVLVADCHGRVYLDFVAQMEEGHLLVFEHEGAHFADGPDTPEKRTISERWERKSGATGSFIVVGNTVGTKRVRATTEQI